MENVSSTGEEVSCQYHVRCETVNRVTSVENEVDAKQIEDQYLDMDMRAG